jgi:hypothetical protein
MVQAAENPAAPGSAKGGGNQLNIMRVGAFGPPCTHPTLAAALADASSAVPNQIRLANNQLYGGINVEVSGRSVEIIGGYADCAAADPGPVRTVLIGDAATELGVLAFRGGAKRRTVQLRNLIIEGGNATPEGGGGIRVEDNVELLLEDVSIRDNDSSNGGGIALVGTVRPVQLIVEGEVDSTSNTATHGGGIECEGGSIRVRGRLRLQDNFAQFSGGGIRLRQCNLDSGPADPVHGVLEVIGNAGGQAGGIVASGASRIDVLGALILGNRSFGPFPIGGGIVLSGAGTVARLRRVNLSENRSPSSLGVPGRAGAAYLEEGARLQIDGGPQPCPSVVHEGWDSRACALIAQNQATDGAAIVTGTGGAELELRQTRIAQNYGSGDIIRLDDAGASLDGVLFDDNSDSTSNGVLLRAIDSAVIIAHATTIANAVATDILSSGVSGQVVIYNSAVLGPGTSLATNGGAISGSCLFADDAALPSALAIDAGAFIDAANGNVEPSPGSPLIDRCAPAPIDPFGFDSLGRVRPFDDPTVPNVAGTHDAGAYEGHGPALVFADGFE